MRIAVLSGKGGAGKTLIAVNLAYTAGEASYVDCDVEEPNGHLFLKPQNIEQKDVCTMLPEFDAEKCTGCRKCMDFCRFNALIYIKNKPMVISEVCHSCGGCALVCDEGAIREVPHKVGITERGAMDGITVVTGTLNPGEASGVPVINAALKEAGDKFTVIDCPPGSACAVTECVTQSDYCVLVAEPTAFGFHNFKMVHELVSLMGKPCGVIINKMEDRYVPLEDYCKSEGLKVLARIPYSRSLAASAANGRLICKDDESVSSVFRDILSQIGGESA